MNGTATLEIPIDAELMRSAEGVLTTTGLDTASPVRVFLMKVATTRSIPFERVAEPEFTPEQEESILAAREESKDPANLEGPFEDVSPSSVREFRSPRPRGSRPTARGPRNMAFGRIEPRMNGMDADEDSSRGGRSFYGSPDRGSDRGSFSFTVKSALMPFIRGSISRPMTAN